MKNLDEKLDQIEEQYGIKIFKNMYRDLVQNLSTLGENSGVQILEIIEEDLDVMLSKRS